MPRKSNTPDLFDRPTDEAVPPRLSSTASLEESRDHLKRILLPGDLAGTLKHLDDEQLDTLFQAVTVEAGRRERLPPQGQTERPARKGRRQANSSRAKGSGQNEPKAIPHGQANLIRAAFKAGIKSTAISRQLGIPLAVVRSVLATPERPSS